MKTSLAAQASTLFALALSTAHAAPLTIDEATYPGASGDYNNLLSPPLPEAVIFDLDAGTNTFAGTFGTPGDAGDTFAVRLATRQTLAGIHVTFATNAGDFNPVAINQGSQIVFDLASSNAPTPLFSLDLTGRPSAPVTFSSAVLDLGPGLYTTTMLTGVLALNDGGKVGYQVAFNVTPAIPEPDEWAMLVAGLAAIGLTAPGRRAFRSVA